MSNGSPFQNRLFFIPMEMLKWIFTLRLTKAMTFKNELKLHYLGTNLVTTLTSLHMYDFPHFVMLDLKTKCLPWVFLCYCVCYGIIIYKLCH